VVLWISIKHVCMFVVVLTWKVPAAEPTSYSFDCRSRELSLAGGEVDLNNFAK
jgi:hypothetical protein